MIWGERQLPEGDDYFRPGCERDLRVWSTSLPLEQMLNMRCRNVGRKDKKCREEAMPKSVDRIALGGTSLGTTRHLLVHRHLPAKPAAEPRKVYIQASLHAD